ncbi:L10-interacting MYB domain-containing protein, partial [Camellia lanceoleosa]
MYRFALALKDLNRGLKQIGNWGITQAYPPTGCTSYGCAANIETVKMKMSLRSRVDSRSSHLRRKRNQDTTIVRQGKRKSTSSSDNPPNCSVTPVDLFYYMASFMSTATSTQPGPMCACGYGHCVVKISRSAKNPRRAYYQCSREVPCVNWIGWCDEYGRQTAAENDRDNVRRFEVHLIDIEQSLRVLKVITCVLSIIVAILLFRIRMDSTRSGSRTLSGKRKGPKPYHKANWDWENSRIYLELVIKEIEAGNRPHMSINLNGYRSLAKTYEAATGLTHSMKQLKNKYNQLKAEWRAWSKLMDSRKGPTGIGFDQESGLINASDEWWATMEKVDKECCKFRTKRLEHEELMRRVFTGAAATGKHAWTPGEMRNQLEVEGESGSADFSTDSNEMGASDTANLMKSANINPSGKALATRMDDLVNSVKTQSKELTVNHVVGGQSVTMAEAVARLYEIQGLDQTNPLLHFGISFMEVPNNREMVIPSDEGIIGWLQVKQQDKERTTTVPTLASILRSQGLPSEIASDYYKAHVLKVPCRTSILTGRAWILELYNGHNGRFRYELCMPKVVFTRLCATLVNDFGLHVPEREHGLHVEESVAIFIHVLKNLPNRELQERFQHSGETISRHFHNVLKAMKKFTDCLGTLDGTHVQACIKESEAAPYFSRKGCHTQNILAVCDFNMCFVFVSCGWEGSMHDSRILNIVTEDPQYNFPSCRYYLVDSGYSNKRGFLAPYKGSHYHQPHFQRHKPRNRDELFNRAHSSLRSVIEFLHNMPRFDFRRVQVPLVAASMALHNFIRRNCDDDATIAVVRNATEYTYADIPDRADLAALDEAVVSTDDDVEMAEVRHRIRAELYQIRRNGMSLSESFQVVALIEKLVQGWKDFKISFKHKCKEIFLVRQLVSLVFGPSFLRFANDSWVKRELRFQNCCDLPRVGFDSTVVVVITQEFAGRCRIVYYSFIIILFALICLIKSGGWLCTNILQIHCHALSCSLLQQSEVWQQKLVNRPVILAGRPLFLVFSKEKCLLASSKLQTIFANEYAMFCSNLGDLVYTCMLYASHSNSRLIIRIGTHHTALFGCLFPYYALFIFLQGSLAIFLPTRQIIPEHSGSLFHYWACVVFVYGWVFCCRSDGPRWPKVLPADQLGQ